MLTHTRRLILKSEQTGLELTIPILRSLPIIIFASWLAKTTTSVRPILTCTPVFRDAMQDAGSKQLHRTASVPAAAILVSRRSRRKWVGIDPVETSPTLIFPGGRPFKTVPT